MKLLNNHILYLEDEQQILDMFAVNFRRKFNVHVTTDYSEAIQILQENEVKVVLSDQRMPDITGIEFIKQINKDFPDIICILISGYADKSVLFKSVNEVDVFQFMEKPVDFNELSHTIKKAIEKYDAIKEKQRLESELQIALKKAQESDRLKAEFLASLSHEIRAPVNGVVGFASLIKENRKDDISPEYLEIISKSALRIVDIIDDMVLASKIKTGEANVQQHEVYLNDLFDDVYNTFLPEIEEKGTIQFSVKKRTGKFKIPITTDRERYPRIRQTCYI